MIQQQHVAHANHSGQQYVSTATSHHTTAYSHHSQMPGKFNKTVLLIKKIKKLYLKSRSGSFSQQYQGEPFVQDVHDVLKRSPVIMVHSH